MGLVSSSPHECPSRYRRRQCPLLISSEFNLNNSPYSPFSSSLPSFSSTASFIPQSLRIHCLYGKSLIYQFISLTVAGRNLRCQVICVPETIVNNLFSLIIKANIHFFSSLGYEICPLKQTLTLASNACLTIDGHLWLPSHCPRNLSHERSSHSPP